ncbi:MAG TPA: 7TM-DISM domain-containing protein, partial [Steroidobacteraceae bacterium]
MLRKLLAFTVVSLAPALFAAGVTLPANESVQVQSLSTSIELLEDPGGALDVEAVSRSPASSGFVAGTPEKANVGFSRSAWWVRLTVRNQGAETRDLYLRQGYPLIDQLDVYQPQDLGKDGGWHHVATGDRRPFGSRPVAHRDYLFPLTLPADSQTTVYLRYASQGPVDINLSLLDPNKL